MTKFLSCGSLSSNSSIHSSSWSVVLDENWRRPLPLLQQIIKTKSNLCVSLLFLWWVLQRRRNSRAEIEQPWLYFTQPRHAEESWLDQCKVTNSHVFQAIFRRCAMLASNSKASVEFVNFAKTWKCLVGLRAALTIVQLRGCLLIYLIFQHVSILTLDDPPSPVLV